MFNHRVGAGEERRWDLEAEGAGGLEAHHKPEKRWLLDWQIGGLGALENPRRTVRVNGSGDGVRHMLAAAKCRLFNHRIGAGEQRRWNLNEGVHPCLLAHHVRAGQLSPLSAR